uniref:Uncharacterized protein n=1 Tax=Arundo donax TaxID=35708 RepID=A0A0A9AHA9_ARUDO
MLNASRSFTPRPPSSKGVVTVSQLTMCYLLCSGVLSHKNLAHFLSIFLIHSLPAL